MHGASYCPSVGFEVVAPPGSIPSVKQFLERVAWPGAQPSLYREDEGPTAQVPQHVEDASSEATIPEPYMEATASLERSQEVTSDPPTPVVDLSSPQHAVDPSTSILNIPEDPTTPVLTLNTSPSATPLIWMFWRNIEFLDNKIIVSKVLRVVVMLSRDTIAKANGCLHEGSTYYEGWEKAYNSQIHRALYAKKVGDQKAITYNLLSERAKIWANKLNKSVLHKIKIHYPTFLPPHLPTLPPPLLRQCRHCNPHPHRQCAPQNWHGHRPLQRERLHSPLGHAKLHSLNDAVILLHISASNSLFGTDWGFIDLCINTNPNSGKDDVSTINNNNNQKLEDDFNAVTSPSSRVSRNRYRD
ncbi:hypothetical protein JHK86_018834 [Glycine max]|nr:hypothetical protein JHK86_018834 [Glycine max]